MSVGRLLSWCLLLGLLLGSSSLAQKPDFKAAVQQREKRLGELKAEIKQLPALTAELEALEKQLQALVKSTGKQPPEQPAPVVPSPTLTAVTPVNYPDYTPGQQAQLKQLDQEIRQVEAMLPVVQERRTRIARMKAQVALMKKSR
ncbi:MAG: hypothetical protein AB1758_27835 [Candidatus Eremiobacterota bacterium]